MFSEIFNIYFLKNTTFAHFAPSRRTITFVYYLVPKRESGNEASSVGIKTSITQRFHLFCWVSFLNPTLYSTGQSDCSAFIQSRFLPTVDRFVRAVHQDPIR